MFFKSILTSLVGMVSITALSYDLEPPVMLPPVAHPTVVTDWVVVVSDGYTASECAMAIESQTNAEISKILSTVGVVFATTNTYFDGEALEYVDCVKAYERYPAFIPL